MKVSKMVLPAENNPSINFLSHQGLKDPKISRAFLVLNSPVARSLIAVSITREETFPPLFPSCMPARAGSA